MSRRGYLSLLMLTQAPRMACQHLPLTCALLRWFVCVSGWCPLWLATLGCAWAIGTA